MIPDPISAVWVGYGILTKPESQAEALYYKFSATTVLANYDSEQRKPWRHGIEKKIKRSYYTR